MRRRPRARAGRQALLVGREAGAYAERSTSAPGALADRRPAFRERNSHWILGCATCLVSFHSLTKETRHGARREHLRHEAQGCQTSNIARRSANRSGHAPILDAVGAPPASFRRTRTSDQDQRPGPLSHAVTSTTGAGKGTRMSFWQALIYGIVQGLGEFLPISSSAHLTVLPWLMRWEDPGLAFDVALHVGTLIALVVYF